MTVTVYKSNDTGAPTLDGKIGSLNAIIKACLVDGYGTKSAAGWTLALEDAPNYKMILRNNPTTGNGRYYRFQDDTKPYSGYSGTAGHIATMRGCESYTDIDTTAGNFPNVDGADTSDHATYYGVSIIKANSNNAAGPFPWILVADDRTCYFNCGWNTTGKTDPFDAAYLETHYHSGIGFGDFEPLNGSVDSSSSFILGNGFVSNDSSGSMYFGEGDLTSGAQTSHYLHKGIEGNTGAIEFCKAAMVQFMSKTFLGGTITDTAGYSHDYPSPITGGLITTPIVIQENTNAVERTEKHTFYEAGKRGKFRGLLATPHNLKASNTKKLGAPGDTLTLNGRTYLLTLTGDGSTNVTLLIDTTGPW